MMKSIPFAFLLYVLAATSALSATTYPTLTRNILPQIGQRGTDVDVTLRGGLLQTLKEVKFYQPGIACVDIQAISAERHTIFDRAVDVKAGEAAKLTFRIAANARIGEYQFRLRTEAELSEILTFWVTPFPIVDEENPWADNDKARNDTPETAQVVDLNVTVSGYVRQQGYNDFDCYKLRLNKGQRITCQVLNARLGTHHNAGLTDMALDVHGPDGKRLGRCDDSALFGQDPFLDITAQQTGDHIITARQQMDYETSIRHYALHIAEARKFPRPSVSYPLGGQIGKNFRLKLFYADGSTGTLPVRFPNATGPFEERLLPLPAISSFPDVPSPNQLKVSPYPNLFEKPGHNKPESAQPVSGGLPIALNGIIDAEGQRDWYRFSAKKGQRFRVRSYARTLGSPLDPFIWIRPAEGNPSSQRFECDDSPWIGHDWEGHAYRHQVKDRLDPILMFEPDTDGDYLIGVGDTRREYGPDYVYRVEFEPHRDSLFTYLTSYPSQADITRDRINIHRGSSTSHPIAILNGFGSRYDGPIRLEARGLPPGVTFSAPTFTSKESVILGMFSAPANTPTGTHLIELVPIPLEKGATLDGALAITTTATNRRGDYAMYFNKTRKLAVAITEPAPFDVSIRQPDIGLARDAELELDITINRKAGFDEDVYLEMDWIPTGVTRQPPLIIPAGQTSGKYKISATKQAPTGKHALSITARKNKGGDPRSGIGFQYVAAKPIQVEILDPYLTIDLERCAIEQGKSGVLRGTVKHLRPFEGVATATLLRLPNGATLTGKSTIKPGQTTVEFPIQIIPDALTGLSKEITCAVSITDAGQTLEQRTGNGTLRIDPARN